MNSGVEASLETQSMSFIEQNFVCKYVVYRIKLDFQAMWGTT